MIESSVGSKTLWDRDTGSSIDTACSDSTSTLYEKDEDRLSFLDLPYEIRLRIYHLIHLSSPIQYPKFAPWNCIKNCRTYTVQVTSSEDDSNESETSSVLHKGIPRPRHRGDLLPPNRSLCRIPTAVVQTCRQVYDEARVIPFRKNEFVFINWLSLGLSSAVAFMQCREQWQRVEMRFMRLEVFAQDLVPGSAKFADWVQLCGHLPGLRGLRLMVHEEGRAGYQAFGKGMDKMSTGAVLVDEKGVLNAHELVREGAEWIVEGLARLRQLRQLEIELADVKWAAREKGKWCARLRELLVASNEGERELIQVVCVGRDIGHNRRPGP